jgi:hypothetical protein
MTKFKPNSLTRREEAWQGMLAGAVAGKKD